MTNMDDIRAATEQCRQRKLQSNLEARFDLALEKAQEISEEMNEANRVCGAQARSDRRVAIHEAAHAVVAWRTGYPVQVVEVFPSVGCGRCGNELGTDPLPQAVIAMAGHAAEVQLYEHPMHQVPFEDYCGAAVYGFRGGRTMRTVVNIARALVDEHMGDVKLVADALLASEPNRIGYREMEALLGPCEPEDDIPGSRFVATLLTYWVELRIWLTAIRARRKAKTTVAESARLGGK